MKINIKMAVAAFLLVMFPYSVYPSSLWAAKQYQFPSQSVLERQTVFNNLTDYFATMGKSPKERERIQMKRKSRRKKERVQKANTQKKAALQKQIKQQQKIIMEKIKARKAKY